MAADIISISGVIVPVLTWLLDKIENRSKQNQINFEKDYQETIKPSYENLTKIHDDYIKNLSALKTYLEGIEGRDWPLKDLEELIIWLRDKGLEYRRIRESVWGEIETRYLRVNSKSIDYSKGKKEEFLWLVREYLESVLKYYEITISDKKKSYYRDFESQLIVILNNIKNQQSKKAIINAPDFVQDIFKELIDICDNQLPKQFKEVDFKFNGIKQKLYEVK